MALQLKLSSYALSLQMHIVVEAVLNWRPVAQMTAVDAFHGFAHDVGGAVPENGLRLWVVKLEQLERAVALEHSVQIPYLAVHLGDDGVVGQSLTNATSHLVWSSLPGSGIHLLAIGQSYLNGFTGLGCQFGKVLCLALVPEDVALLNVFRQGIQFCWGLEGLEVRFLWKF